MLIGIFAKALHDFFERDTGGATESFRFAWRSNALRKAIVISPLVYFVYIRLLNISQIPWLRYYSLSKMVSSGNQSCMEERGKS